LQQRDKAMPGALLSVYANVRYPVVLEKSKARTLMRDDVRVLAQMLTLIQKR
jgi:hypothetical protein